MARENLENGKTLGEIRAAINSNDEEVYALHSRGYEFISTAFYDGGSTDDTVLPADTWTDLINNNSGTSSRAVFTDAVGAGGSFYDPSSGKYSLTSFGEIDHVMADVTCLVNSDVDNTSTKIRLLFEYTQDGTPKSFTEEKTLPRVEGAGVDVPMSGGISFFVGTTFSGVSDATFKIQALAGEDSTMKVKKFTVYLN